MPVLCKLRCELLVIFFIDMYYLLLSDIKRCNYDRLKVCTQTVSNKMI